MSHPRRRLSFLEFISEREILASAGGNGVRWVAHAEQWSTEKIENMHSFSVALCATSTWGLCCALFLLRGCNEFCGSESSEKLVVAQLVKMRSASYGTQISVTMFVTPATGPYPEPDKCSAHSIPRFCNIQFNITLPSKLRSTTWVCFL